MMTTYAAAGYGEVGTGTASTEHEALKEKHVARTKIEERKQAQELERQAIARREDAERRWHTRLEEKTRYTDEQRAWWDEQARQHLQRDTSLAKDGSTHLSAEVLERQRKEAYKEHLEAYEDLQMKREKVEKLDAELARRERVAREKNWQLSQQESKQKAVDFGKGLEKRKDNAAKEEMKKQTAEEAAHKAKLESVKARLGENTRVGENKKFESTEARREEQRQKGEDIKKGRFREDEALRKAAKDAKAQKKKDIHNSVMSLHQQQEADRLAEEKAKRIKEKKEKKEFQERLRKQTANKTLAEEHAKHVEAEKMAEHAMYDAQLAQKQAEKWTGHMTNADKALHSEMDKVNLDKNAYQPHTDYERHQWKIFGSAQSDEPNMLGFLGSALNLNNKDL